MIPYIELSSPRNPVFQTIYKLSSESAARGSEGLFVCEGIKLLNEAVRSNLTITTIVVSPDCLAEHGKNWDHLGNVKGYICPPRVIAGISTQLAPEGVIFVAKQPSHKLSLKKGRYAVLDSIADPGNMGTLFRSAEAFGLSGLIICGNSTDPYNPKCVRGSMGALLRLPFIKCTAEKLYTDAQSCGRVLAAATLDDEAVTPDKLDFSLDIPVIGSESHGISKELLSMCSKKVKIPMTGPTESLNAAIAGSIIMYHSQQSVV